mgnify:CR=1 FL=1
MDIQRGTQIIGVWGATVSESHGFVSCIQDTNKKRVHFCTRFLFE